MSCGCTKNNRTVVTTSNPSAQPVKTGEVLVKAHKDVSPTDQCLECCVKHMDEAWCAFNEYSYTEANRRFIRGSLRAIVLHSFREWEPIAKLARECALLIQHGKDKEAVPKMEELCGKIDAEYYKANAEVVRRIEQLAKEKNDESNLPPSTLESVGKPD
jgi:hypothetical protein